MKTTLIIICILFLSLTTYYLFFPKNTFFTFYLPNKGGIVFSKTKISYQSPPDSFQKDGMNHLSPYISKLLLPSAKFKYLLIFTPDGARGLGLDAKAGSLKVGFTIDWRKHPEKEKNIRDYFHKINIEPSEDYLGGNGGVPDATRLLSYPIKGDEAEVSRLVKDILQKLCDISPNEALDIRYVE